jgi:hypothetical protein
MTEPTIEQEIPIYVKMQPKAVRTVRLEIHPTIETMTRDVFGWLHPGGCWHEKTISTMGRHQCSCGAIFDVGVDIINHTNRLNPEYISPAGRVLLLREMEVKKPHIFLRWLVTLRAVPPEQQIADYITDDTGLLLKAVYDFITGKATP